MSKIWLVVLSDGTTWELVSPGVRLYEVDEVEAEAVGDRLRELTDQKERVALVDLLVRAKAHYGDWSFVPESVPGIDS